MFPPCPSFSCVKEHLNYYTPHLAQREGKYKNFLNFVYFL